MGDGTMKRCDIKEAPLAGQAEGLMHAALIRLTIDAAHDRMNLRGFGRR